jgi:membrane-bound metal-dependent hydrolase YbcI (DUF457 family)
MMSTIFRCPLLKLPLLRFSFSANDLYVIVTLFFDVIFLMKHIILSREWALTKLRSFIAVFAKYFVDSIVLRQCWWLWITDTRRRLEFEKII